MPYFKIYRFLGSVMLKLMIRLHWKPINR